MKNHVVCVAVVLFFPVTAAFADEVSGKSIFEEQCTECHRASNYSGGNPNKLAETIGKIAAGNIKHPVEIALDHEQVAAVAQYMTRN